MNRRSERLDENIAEIAATVFGAVIGGICISQLGVQPASTTGAMLQEAMHYVQPPLAGSLTSAAKTDLQIMNFLQFSVVLFAIAFGTCLGRTMRLSLKLRNVTLIAVPALSVVAIALTTRDLYTQGVITYVGKSLLGALFGTSMGILWGGGMPRAQSTTARSALVKRAALGEWSAAVQAAAFLLIVGVVVSTFYELGPKQKLRLAGVLFFGLISVGSGYVATERYLRITDDGKEPPPPQRIGYIMSGCGLLLVLVCTWVF